jgi:hypothetical protein
MDLQTNKTLHGSTNKQNITWIYKQTKHYMDLQTNKHGGNFNYQ